MTKFNKGDIVECPDNGDYITGTVDHVDEDGRVWCYFGKYDAVLWTMPALLTKLTVEV